MAMMDWTSGLTDQEIEEIMSTSDTDKNGYIDLSEFLHAFGPHPATREEITGGLHTLSRSADAMRPAYLGVRMQNMSLSSIEALGAFTQLLFVDVQNNLLTDLRPLGLLRFMVTLDASHNRLTRVLDFRGCPHLTQASLKHNAITEVNDISPHRALQTLDLTGNQISHIQGMARNMALSKLIMDDNRIVQISGLDNLPIHHLSLRNNRLSAVNGHALLGPNTPYIQALQTALELSFDEIDDAFLALDANMDGRVSRKELRAGLSEALGAIGVRPGDSAILGSGEDGPPADPEGFKAWFDARLDDLMATLDREGTGFVSAQEFSALFRRADEPVEGSAGGAGSGIKTLSGLDYIDLSGNPIKSLKGLEGHPRLRKVLMAGCSVSEISELEPLEYLPMLEELDLTGAPVCAPSESAAQSRCFRIRAIQKLLPKNGRTKLSVLNKVLVVAEERVASLNFHDQDDLQYMDTKRDDAQDLPPSLFQ
uniref:EF-hand domain-containing protein n=3 Tax=Hemiselmis andersenii TaxID=464988 RepID=A0A7S1EBT2_HEMAN